VPDGHVAGAVARIGPNALTRVAEALGPEDAARVFAAAGLSHRLAAPPDGMVPEDEVVALHQALRHELGTARARAEGREAGRLTALYLLAHRIPRPAQRVLRWLPAPLAARALLAAIARHAWTFAGSAAFRARAGHPCVVELDGAPTCRGTTAGEPLCDYYAATFETLFRTLVHRASRVEETECGATGAPACRFEIACRGAQPTTLR
jgi:divinyl protochlorophyllide a 8-vinyl-reductase